MPKTRITERNERHVLLEFDDLLSGERITMDIWAIAPRKGGQSYVRYNGDKQLCNGLSSRGETLTYAEGTKLVDLVRREYRAMRAADKKALGA